MSAVSESPASSCLEEPVALPPAAEGRGRGAGANNKQTDADDVYTVFRRMTRCVEPRGDEGSDRDESDALGALHVSAVELDAEALAARPGVAHHHGAGDREHHGKEPQAVAEKPREAGKDKEFGPAVGDRVEKGPRFALPTGRPRQAAVEDVETTREDVEPSGGRHMARADRQPGPGAGGQRHHRHVVGGQAQGEKDPLDRPQHPQEVVDKEVEKGAVLAGLGVWRAFFEDAKPAVNREGDDKIGDRDEGGGENEESFQSVSSAKKGTSTGGFYSIAV